MLDGLLGRGFSSKCKSLIKATRTRLDVVRRRKEATQRFLKGNLAQLLSNGLDINAFGRTEEFLAGLNLLACYDFLEQSCEHILKKLSMMQKHSECPEECREAVGSLMFAAARFSDLPELRDLRDALQERYESSLEHFVNQEFFERLAMKPPTEDRKIQLLEDIASELSIKWDSKGFQHRMMANSSVPAQNQAKKHELIHDRVITFNSHKDNEAAINSNKRDQLVKAKSELNGDRLKAKNDGGKSLTRKDEVGHRSFRGVESTGSGGKPHMGRGSECKTAERDDYDMTARGRKAKGELSSNELQEKNGSENSLMRKDELNNLSLGHNAHRRDNYNGTLGARLEGGDFSSDKLQVTNGRENYLKRKEKSDILFLERGDSMSSAGNTPPMVIYDISPHRRREVTGNNEPTRINGKEDSVRRRNGHESSSHGKRSVIIDEQNTSQEETYGVTPRPRRDLTDDNNELTRKNGKEETVHRRERHGSSSKGKRLEVTDSLHEVQNNKELNAATSLKITQRDDTDLLKPNSSFALPPPYIKSKDKRVPPPYVKTIEAQKTSSSSGGASVNPKTHKRYDMDERSERIRHEEDSSNYEASPFRDHVPLPRPRSIRKKQSKSSSNCDNLGDSEDLEAPKRSSSSRRRDHHSKKGLQILFEEEHKERDDEDRKLDKLLLHYCKKPSAYDEEKVRRKMKSQARDNEGEVSGVPTRSISLPREQIPAQEQVKVYARANSFQPAGHVHPKLPDYDDLAAQFAALRGR